MRGNKKLLSNGKVDRIISALIICLVLGSVSIVIIKGKDIYDLVSSRISKKDKFEQYLKDFNGKIKYAIDKDTNLYSYHEGSENLEYKLLIENTGGIKQSSIKSSHIILTNKGELYVWGFMSEFNNNEENNRKFRKVLDDVAEYKIDGDDKKFFNILALKSNGDLYGWGYNTNGEIGNGLCSESNLSNIVLNPYLILSNVKSFDIVKDSDDGYYTCAAISKYDELYVWGVNKTLIYPFNKNQAVKYYLLSPVKKLDKVKSFKFEKDSLFAITEEGYIELNELEVVDKIFGTNYSKKNTKTFDEEGMAKAYYDILNNIAYGSQQLNFYSQDKEDLKGLVYANQIDFDNNGSKELFITYLTNVEYVYEIWGYNGSAYKIHSDSQSISSLLRGYKGINLVTVDNVTYLNKYNNSYGLAGFDESTTDDFYTIQNNKWVLVDTLIKHTKLTSKEIEGYKAEGKLPPEAGSEGNPFIYTIKNYGVEKEIDELEYINILKKYNYDSRLKIVFVGSGSVSSIETNLNISEGDNQCLNFMNSLKDNAAQSKNTEPIKKIITPQEAEKFAEAAYNAYLKANGMESTPGSRYECDGKLYSVPYIDGNNGDEFYVVNLTFDSSPGQGCFYVNSETGKVYSDGPQNGSIISLSDN